MHVPKILHQNEHSSHYYCISYQNALICNYFYCFLADHSHLTEVRSNRAVTYSNTTVSKSCYTLTKESVIEDFGSTIVSIIGLDFLAVFKSVIGSFQSIIGSSLVHC